LKPAKIFEDFYGNFASLCYISGASKGAKRFPKSQCRAEI